MLLRLSRRCVKLALFAPLILSPLFVGETFAFPVNGFFPFISLKAIYFRVIVESALLFLILHLLCSTSRKAQWSALRRQLLKPLPLAVICFAAVLLITALLGENPTQSIWSNFERGEGVFQIIHYCAFFFLVLVLFRKKEEILRLMHLNIFVSFLICLYAIPQFFNIQAQAHTIGGGTRISGTLGNPSYLAGYLLINFAFIIYAYLQTTSTTNRRWLVALTIFELFIFLNTGTRAAYLALAIGIAIVYCMNIFIAKDPRTRTRLIIILVGLAAFGATGLGAYHVFPELQKGVIFDRLFNIEGAAKGFEPRGWTWNSALSGISDRPILGWGTENFAYSFDKYYNPRHYGLESFFDRTHNIFLEYLISGGVVLLTAYLIIWYCYYRNLRGRRKDFWYSILVTVPVVYLIQAFFLFDVLPIYLILFLFIALAINLDAAPEHVELDEDGYELGHAELLTGTGLLALFLFIIIATSFIPWKKNMLITAAYGAPPENPQAGFNAFQEAVLYKSVVGQEEAISGLMKFSIDLFDAAVRQHVAIPNEIVRGIVDTNNSWFDAYRHTMPGLRDWYLNGGLNLKAGLGFGIPEYTERGKQLYAEALAYAPTRIEFIQMLLEVARATENKKDFKVYLERAIELRPDIPWQELNATSTTSLTL